MSKFCSYCGKPLEDGEVCSCRQNAAPAQQPVQQAAPQQSNPQVDKAKAVANGYISVIKDYIKAPFATTAKAISQKNIVASVITMVIYWIAVALFMFATFTKVGDTFDEFGVDVSVPFFSTALYALLMAAVILACSIVVLFAVLKIFKVNVNFMQTTVAVGVNAILPTACVLLAAICMFISVKVAVALLAVGVVVWAVLGAAMTFKFFGVADSVASIGAVAIGFAIVFALSFYINSKFVFSAAGKIEVEDEPIEDYVEMIQEAFEDFDFENMLSIR